MLAKPVEMPCLRCNTHTDMDHLRRGLRSRSRALLYSVLTLIVMHLHCASTLIRAFAEYGGMLLSPCGLWW